MPWEEWFDPSVAKSANGLLYFFEDDGVHGRELWRSDGAALGTFMIRDLCPGSCGSRFWAAPTALEASSGVLFFTANDGVHGLELWITDGTALGTEMVADLAPGLRSSQPRLLTDVGGQILFVARSDGLDEQLWRSDGTAAGTYPVPMPPGVERLTPTSIHLANGFAFLCNAVSEAQTELWRTDGTAGGTSFVASVYCSSTSNWWKGAPATVLPDGSLLFAGVGTFGGSELWRSDGTPAGTSMVLDIEPGPASSYPDDFVATPSLVYFTVAAPWPANSALWRTDGTLSGTYVVPLPDGAAPWMPLGSFAAQEETLYFAAYDEAHGAEPWILDAFGPRRIADVAAGTESSIISDSNSYNSSLFAVLSDGLYFTATDGLFGTELWKSDGTEAGTERVSDLAPGAESLRLPPTATTVEPWTLGDRLLFRETAPATGLRLWVMDPSALEPALLRNSDVQTSAFEPVGRDRAFLYELNWGRVCFESAADHLFFEFGEDSLGALDLWTTDGSTSGTEIRFPGTLGAPIVICGSDGEHLYFVGGGSGDRALRTLGGVPGDEIVLLAGLPDNSGISSLPPLLVTPSGLDVGIGDALVETDGTPEGTSVRSDGAVGSPGWIAPLGSEVVMSGAGLAITNADEPSGALFLGADGWGQELAALPASLVAVVDDETHGSELWTTDGTPEGTALLADILPGPEGGLSRGNVFDFYSELYESRLASLGDSVLLAANDGTHGTELWVTDGTFSGTGLLKDIYPGEYPSTPRRLTRLGDQVLFTAEDEEHGLELWTTDGTYEGTHLLKDLAPGAASSVPDDLVVRDGTLYFSAWTPAYGREAWKSDGTPGGTVRISDIAPGSLSSSPQRFSRTVDRLYFTATDQVHGFELWAISDDGLTPLFLDGFESSDTSRWSLTQP